MTQFNAPTYDLARPTGQCALSGIPIEPGDRFVATLVEEGDDLQRVDISQSAWEEGRRPENLFSDWITTQPTPEAKKKLFVDDQVLLNLLDRLEDAEQFQRLAFRFVLTLILMRKKLLRYDRSEKRVALEPIPDTPNPAPSPEDIPDTNSDNSDAAEEKTASPATPPKDYVRKEIEQEFWLLTPKLDPSKGPMGKWHDDKTITVLNPQLDEDGIRAVTDQLSQILQAEL